MAACPIIGEGIGVWGRMARVVLAGFFTGGEGPEDAGGEGLTADRILMDLTAHSSKSDVTAHPALMDLTAHGDE